MTIASALRSEISRIAHKELRSQTQQLKKTTASLRSEIAALKRRARALERELRRLSKSQALEGKQPPARAADEGKHRFSAKGLAAQRKRLGLSAHELGLLIGTSGQSIYNWESGSNRPRRSQLPAIAALRHLGKKAAMARLRARRSAD
jgi:DNA-binding transcriptional regulator YiaG